jgi:hypothetical protein
MSQPPTSPVSRRGLLGLGATLAAVSPILALHGDTPRDTHAALPGEAGSPPTFNPGEAPNGVRELYVNVMRYGAKGDGVTDDTAAFQAAFDASPPDGCVILPQGGHFSVTTIKLPAKNLVVLAHGARVIAASAGEFAFVQSNRQRITWQGGTFAGSGSGFKLDLPPSDLQSYDVSFSDVAFMLEASAIGLYLKGGREGSITNCFFDICTGIYLDETVNTHIIGCQFRNCVIGVHGDGHTASKYNAGIMVANCTMIGCGVGVYVLAHDWLNATNCVIDYCDQPILLINQNAALVQGSYISNREYADKVSPVIQIVSDSSQAGEPTRHISIVNCLITNNVDDKGASSVGISVSGETEWTSIDNCTIHFWHKYGIRVTGISTHLKVIGNNIIDNSSIDGASILGTEGNDATWLIADNYLSKPITGVIQARTRDNVQ